MTVLERVCRDFKFELPSTSVRALELDLATVEDPRGRLTGLLKENESARRKLLAAAVRQFADRFEQENGLKLQFDPGAQEAIVEQCLREDREAGEVCRRLFHDFEYGLKLILRNTGQSSFRVTRRVVEDPSGELSNWVAESFGSKRPTDGGDA
jgi:hypothetical protein